MVPVEFVDFLGNILLGKAQWEIWTIHMRSHLFLLKQGYFLKRKNNAGPLQQPVIFPPF